MVRNQAQQGMRCAADRKWLFRHLRQKRIAEVAFGALHSSVPKHRLIFLQTHPLARHATASPRLPTKRKKLLALYGNIFFNSVFTIFRMPTN